jgi:hypothetical protein
MVAKLEDSRRPARFASVGRWVFEPVLMKGREAPTSRALVLTVADSAGKRIGKLLWDGKEVAREELVVGGDAIWGSVDIDNQTLELELEVQGDAVTGTWTYGWGNNGRLQGKRER